MGKRAFYPIWKFLRCNAHKCTIYSQVNFACRCVYRMAWFEYHDLHVTAYFSCTLQVQRIEEYHKLLVRLFQLTSEDHPDHYDLRYTITCVESVHTLLTLKRVRQVGVGEATSSSKSFEMLCIPVSVWLTFFYKLALASIMPQTTPRLTRKVGKLMKCWKAESGLGAKLTLKAKKKSRLGTACSFS